MLVLLLILLTVGATLCYIKIWNEETAEAFIITIALGVVYMFIVLVIVRYIILWGYDLIISVNNTNSLQ
jgi:Zn-dependent protease with chaperone function